ncbi:unnamed protein product [Paramecium pentaurelia]|uniref:Uncharacterized protein n=1 Tax=Paramecium pentaurelia TaxID=43138 RepID=A0A8S1U155_9CILI|nr:unnamed protein product [Paramecium pentaurelia]
MMILVKMQKRDSNQQRKIKRSQNKKPSTRGCEQSFEDIKFIDKFK